MADWVQYARAYTAQGTDRAREQAIAACPDGDIKTVLQYPPTWKTANQRLIAQRRMVEAGTVELLGLRPLANPVHEIERLDAQQRNAAIAACNRAVAVSHALRFGECEAYFLAMFGLCSLKLRDFLQATTLLTRALELRREALKSDPIYDHYIAGTLSNLSIAYSERRLLQEAVASLDEALTIYRRLAVSHPDYYRPYIARTLVNVGVVKKNARDFTGSLAALDESIQTYRGLSETQLAANKDELAGALAALALTQRGVRDLPAARRSVEEARGVYRNLAKSDTRPWTSYIGLTSHNLGNILMDQGASAQAEAEYLEAVNIYQPLAEQQPKTYNGPLASTLNKLAAVWLQNGRSGDAVTTYRQALSLYKDLATEQPEVYRPDVAGTLESLAGAQEQNSDAASALKSRAEAMEIARQLAAAPGSVHKPELARMLNNQASTARKQGDEPACDKAAKEAIELVEGSTDPSSRWLAKAGVLGAYKHVLELAVKSNQPDAVFRALAALREGPVCAFGNAAEEGLEAACRALGIAAKKVGRPICVLGAQSMHRSSPGQDGNILLALLSDSSLWYEACYPFATAAYALFTELQGVFSQGKPAGAVYWKQRMAELGAAAWKALPQAVRDVLHPDSGTEVLISGDTYWAAFPWEALRFGDGEHDYLGFARSLAHWGPLTARALSVLGDSPAPLNTHVIKTAAPDNGVAAVICPWDLDPRKPLTAAKAEAEALRQELTAFGLVHAPASPALGPNATRASVLTALKSGLSVFHYTGHGGIIENEEVLLTHGGAFGSSDLRDLNEPAFVDGALVVLNSCLTGRVRDYGGRREDLAAAFLDQGARGVLASALPIADPIGQVAGTAIYALAREAPIGTAVADLRRIVASLASMANSSSYPTWTMLQYHGDPWFRLNLRTPVASEAAMPGFVQAVASFLHETPAKAALIIAELAVRPSSAPGF